MALLEYTNFTVPDVVKKAVNSFYNNDPLLQALKSRGQVKRSGGSNVRMRRVLGRHSDVVEINATNMSVPLNKMETFGTLTGDWARYIKPIILPHIDRDRMQSKEDRATWVKDTTEAALSSLRNDVLRRLYIGDSTVSVLAGMGTLNGSSTVTGTSTGLEKGALEFTVPGTQSSTGNTYLGQARTEDTTNYTDNWFNQYVDHGGIGVSFLKSAEEVKITADTYTDDAEGISIGVLSIADQILLGEEVRTYPGGGTAAAASAMVYTSDDLKSGKAHPTVWMANGVRYYSNRWMTDGLMQGSGSGTSHVYLLNPNTIEYWVNANNDFRVTKFTDHLQTSNQDADIGYIICEMQFVVSNLLANGCLSS